MSEISVVVVECPNAPEIVGQHYRLHPDSGDALELGGDGLMVGFARIEGGLWVNPHNTVLGEVSDVPTTYPDGNPKSVQGAKKFSLRYIPLPAQVEMCRALEDGDKKYGPANWRKTGVAASVYIDAALRHIMQFYDGGQDNADDSGVHNLGHAMACLAIIVDAQYNGSLIDDRPISCKDTDALLLRSKE